MPSIVFLQSALAVCLRVIRGKHDLFSLYQPPQHPPVDFHCVSFHWNDPTGDRKADFDIEFKRRMAPHIIAVEGTRDTYIIRGKLVTPETIFSSKDELEGNARILPMLYLEAVYGLRCPGNEAKGEPSHGLSLKWRGNVQIPYRRHPSLGQICRQGRKEA